MPHKKKTKKKRPLGQMGSSGQDTKKAKVRGNWREKENLQSNRLFGLAEAELAKGKGEKKGRTKAPHKARKGLSENNLSSEEKRRNH